MQNSSQIILVIELVDIDIPNMWDHFKDGVLKT